MSVEMARTADMRDNRSDRYESCLNWVYKERSFVRNYWSKTLHETRPELALHDLWAEVELLLTNAMHSLKLVENPALLLCYIEYSAVQCTSTWTPILCLCCNSLASKSDIKCALERVTLCVLKIACAGAARSEHGTIPFFAVQPRRQVDISWFTARWPTTVNWRMRLTLARAAWLHESRA